MKWDDKAVIKGKNFQIKPFTANRYHDMMICKDKNRHLDLKVLLFYEPIRVL